jgi:hypothetical protein
MAHFSSDDCRWDDAVCKYSSIASGRKVKMYEDHRFFVKLMCDAVHYRGVEKYGTDRYGVNLAVYMYIPSIDHACASWPPSSKTCEKSPAAPELERPSFEMRNPRLQSRLRALRLSRRRRTRSHELLHISLSHPSVPSNLSTYLILRPLRLQLSPLLLNNHLLLTIRQRPRHTQQQRTRAHDPQRLAAHA